MLFKKIELLEPTATIQEIEVAMHKRGKGFVNRLGDLLDDNDIRRRKKLENIQFIKTFDTEEIVANYNTVSLFKNEQVDKLRKAVPVIKILFQMFSGIKSKKDLKDKVSVIINSL
jgi:hypothetical protein